MDNNDKVIAFLSAVRNTVDDGWTRGSMAEDKDGKKVDPCDSTACAWCLVGAVEHARHASVRDFSDVWEIACEAIANEIVRFSPECLGITEDYTLSSWNDSPIREKEHVVSLLTRTITSIE